MTGDRLQGAALAFFEADGVGKLDETRKQFTAGRQEGSGSLEWKAYDDIKQMFACGTDMKQLLEQCETVQLEDNVIPLTADVRARVLDAAQRARSGGCKVLAVGKCSCVDADEVLFTCGTFLGFVGLGEKLTRKTVDAVRHWASFKPLVIVTGRSEASCTSLFKQLQCDQFPCFNARDIDIETDTPKSGPYILTRVHPEDCYRLVTKMQSGGGTVFYYGAGTNDAPALNCAKVGLTPMGATEVAKEASDFILGDDEPMSLLQVIYEASQQAFVESTKSCCTLL
eukprot:TRINITY_DN2164_c0_g1_i3.p1 TRINITY_DN2164_c0_g1~~TRINITY_DN2164_c0_g1_i3.p1  ORF type:complete len:283 (+),score=55.44 TRINITY_DN2164_c0_g1_i3:266-1114(+)